MQCYVLMGRYGDLDYGFLTKAGFLTGLSLFILGVAGELLGPAYFGPLPGWEETLFFDMEVIGLVIGFFSPFIFGIFLPLTE